MIRLVFSCFAFLLLGVCAPSQANEQGLEVPEICAVSHASNEMIPFIKDHRGPRGHHGHRGHGGKRGKRGPQGVHGPQGLPGNPGPEGPPGKEGAQGPQGEIGSTGSTGATGATGICSCSSQAYGYATHVLTADITEPLGEGVSTSPWVVPFSSAVPDKVVQTPGVEFTSTADNEGFLVHEGGTYRIADFAQVCYKEVYKGGWYGWEDVKKVDCDLWVGVDVLAMNVRVMTGGNPSYPIDEVKLLPCDTLRKGGNKTIDNVFGQATAEAVVTLKSGDIINLVILNADGAKEAGNVKGQLRAFNPPGGTSTVAYLVVQKLSD